MDQETPPNRKVLLLFFLLLVISAGLLVNSNTIREEQTRSEKLLALGLLSLLVFVSSCAEPAMRRATRLKCQFVTRAMEMWSREADASFSSPNLNLTMDQETPLNRKALFFFFLLLYASVGLLHEKILGILDELLLTSRATGIRKPFNGLELSSSGKFSPTQHIIKFNESPLHDNTIRDEPTLAESLFLIFSLVFVSSYAVPTISFATRLKYQFVALVMEMWTRCCYWIFSSIQKRKYIKWTKKSVKHRSILEELVKMIKDQSPSVEKIEVYYVCFEDSFRIGKGSNGTEVFVGLSTDGLEVAVKRLDLKFTCLAEHEKDYLNLPTLVENRHILNYRFHIERYDFAYLALDLQEENLMQFVLSSDRSLADLQSNGPKILRQILLGIKTLHDENILHRDLKPENILVDFEGKMIVADLGICRRLPPGHTVHESIRRGTEGWMAVESLPTDFDDNLLSLEEIRVRYKKQSDVQVLGMLFYFVLTKGFHPFGKWYFDRLTNIWKGEYNLNKLTDPVAKDLIQWMLQHDFTRRPTIEQCLKHPFLNLPERNFGFLTAVGNEREIKKKDHTCTVVQELNEEASLTAPSWKGKIDGEVFSYFNAKRPYADDVADLLRFIRNADIHWNDRPLPPSVQSKVGKPSEYFLNLFPTLPMIVHRILRHDLDWPAKDELKKYFC